MTIDRELTLPPLLEQLRPLLIGRDEPVYLVGGAVRDAVLGHVSYDLDFVVPDNAIALAFHVGDELGAPAFVLDQERDIARVVLAGEIDLDFARFRGADLEADLRARDFTMNAMALPVDRLEAKAIIDPCGGRDDIEAGILRLAHPKAIETDPVRALRAVRFAVRLGYELSEEVRAAARASASQLGTVSAERNRDELLKALTSPEPDRAVRLLDELGLLAELLPEIAALKGVEQTAPHVHPVLTHTISVLRWLVVIEDALFTGKDAGDERAAADVQERLGCYADRLAEHFSRPVDGGLSGKSLLRLGALFHDVGKAQTQTVEADGRIRFLNHEVVGAELAGARLRKLKLSREAVSHVKTIVEGHMRPLWLVHSDNVTRRAVYRYFRATGKAGLDIGLLTIADHLGTFGEPDLGDSWERLLELVDRLFGHYFEAYDETIAPPPLLSGSELIAALELEPGPIVGRLLRLIEEAQAAGDISTREEALELARSAK